MSSASQNRFLTYNPYFISTRTHFNFIKRMFKWLIRYSSSFAVMFISFAKKLPLIGHATILFGYSLDILAFGTNTSNSKFSQAVALLGYASLMILSTLVFIYPSFTGAAIISSFGLIISMYFEGVTILAWFDNFKNLQWQKLNGKPTLDLDHENAQIMFNAAIITFVSMCLKGIALSISTVLPAAALIIVVIAQIAEFGAMLGTLGKEKVNLSQNFKSATTTRPEEEDIKIGKNSFEKIIEPLQEMQPAAKSEKSAPPKIYKPNHQATKSSTSFGISPTSDSLFHFFQGHNSNNVQEDNIKTVKKTI